MKHYLDDLEIPYVDSQTLYSLLHEYKKPRDTVARLISNGELIRLRRGFFIIASRFRRGGQDYPFEQIANLLFGPSYISLEWALSYYQMIPERVTTITSVTIKRPKEYETPIGLFTYRQLSKRRYTVGIDRRTLSDQVGGFLIATPEKALADWVFFTCKNMTSKELIEDLIENKRIEEETLKSLNKEMMAQIANSYHSKIITTLYEIISCSQPFKA